MKRSLFPSFVILLIISFLFPFHSQATQRGIPIKAKTPEGEEIFLYKHSYALVVGNGNYLKKDWDSLPGAIEDAGKVANALERQGFEVILKTDLKRNSFSRVFNEFALTYGKDRDNRLLFYYAGHGYTRKMATKDDLGYLVMVDAPDPEKDPVGFSLASVDMQSMVTQAKMINSRHVLFIFDSCFSGTILNLRDRITPSAISDKVKHPVRQFITAGRADEQNT